VISAATLTIEEQDSNPVSGPMGNWRTQMPTNKIIQNVVIDRFMMLPFVT